MWSEKKMAKKISKAKPKAKQTVEYELEIDWSM